MCDTLLGSWKLVDSDSDNFERFMEAVGVSMLTRKAVKCLKPDFFMSKNGDCYTMKTVSTFKTTEMNFKLNEEFDEETADGRRVKSIVTCENGALTQKQKWANKECTIVREVKNCQLVTTCTCDDVQCVRVYEKK
ncbi:myelin P2 protein-like [Leptodactylus fuscus]|uniref:myelin P2 protein-like n=1 Tax=Leptodactylus fuscus TaxID=238119 RepID=UPI003F4EE054